MAIERRVTFLIGSNIKGLTRGLDMGQSSLKKFGRQANRIGSQMNRNFTLPILGASAAVLKASGDFEQSFADIRKTVDTTERKFGEIEGGMRSLARTIPTSVNELNSLGGVAGQLGVQAGNIVNFTRTIALLGDTTDIEGERAALSLSRFMNVMGTAQQDIGRLGSTVVGLGNNFAAMESEIVETGLSLAPLGKSVGLTEQQILAYATTIAASGGKTEAASTAFQKTASEMQKAVLNGNSNLKVFAKTAGMSAAAFKTAFEQDAAGAIQEFLKGLARIQEEGGSTALVLEKLGLADQRLQREFGKVLGNLDDLDRALGQANVEWERNTALTEEAQKRYKTFNSRLKIAYNWIYDLGIIVGNALIPSVNKLINVTKGVVGWLSSLDKETIQWAASVALVIAGIGPLIWSVGKLATGAAFLLGGLKTLITAMVFLGKAVISAILVGSFTKFTAAMRLARIKGIVPMGKAILTTIKAFALIALKVATVIAIIGGVVLLAKSIVDAWDKVGPFFANLWDGIVKVFARSAKWIIDSIDGLFSFIPGMSGLFEGVKQGLSDMEKAAQERIDARGVVTFGETVTAVLDEMKDNASSAVNFVTGKFQAMSGFVSGLFPDFNFSGEDSGGGSSEEANTAVDWAGLRDQRMSDGGMNIAKKLLPISDDYLKITERMNVATGKFKSITEAALSGTYTAWENFLKDFKKGGQEFKRFMTEQIAGAITQLAKATGESLAGVGNEFKTAFEKVISLVADFAVQLGGILIAMGTAMSITGILSGPGGAYIAAGAALVAIGSGVSAGIDKRAENRRRRAEGGIPGMAMGGIVPPGFPNDSYPAYLTSGEMVVPSPRPLTSMGGGGSNKDLVDAFTKALSRIDWRKRGTDIVAVYDETKESTLR